MDIFNSKHFAFLILAVSIVSLKTYPGVFLRNGGRESWIAIIIASAIIFFLYLYLIKISEKANKPHICEIYQTAMGKRLGGALIGLFVITLIITLIECSSVEANAMRANMLVETPIWYFLLFFIPPCIYVVTRDLVAVITVTVIGIVLIILAGINLGILTARYKHFQMLFPIFRNGVTIDFFICLIKMIGLYGCTSIVLPFLFRVKDSSRSMYRSTIVGLLMLIQMQIVSVSGLVMTFVPSRFESLNYPKLIQTQLVSYSQFIEFGELYVMLQILGGWMLKYIVSFSAIILILENFNISKRHRNYIIFIISAFVYAIAYFTSKNLFILFKFLNYYSYLCLLNFIVIPLIVYTVFHRKTKAINRSG